MNWSRLDVRGLFLSPGSGGECCNSDNGNLVGALRVIVDDLQMTKRQKKKIRLKPVQDK